MSNKPIKNISFNDQSIYNRSIALKRQNEDLVDKIIDSDIENSFNIIKDNKKKKIFLNTKRKGLVTEFIVQLILFIIVLVFIPIIIIQRISNLNWQIITFGISALICYVVQMLILILILISFKNKKMIKVVNILKFLPYFFVIVLVIFYSQDMDLRYNGKVIGLHNSFIIFLFIIRPPIYKLLHLFNILIFLTFVIVSIVGMITGEKTFLSFIVQIITLTLTLIVTTSITYNNHKLNQRLSKIRIMSELKESEILEKEKSINKFVKSVLPQKYINNISTYIQNPKKLTVLYSKYFNIISFLLFDIVNFTQISKEKTLCDVVNMLNKLFSFADKQCEIYNLDKVKTIGDGYLAILPSTGGAHITSHSCRILMASLKINQFVKEEFNNVKIRISNINEEGLIAIFGKLNITFDCYGNSVFLLDYLESTSKIGCIHVNYNFFKKIQNYVKQYEILVHKNIMNLGDFKSYLIKNVNHKKIPILHSIPSSDLNNIVKIKDKNKFTLTKNEKFLGLFFSKIFEKSFIKEKNKFENIKNVIIILFINAFNVVLFILLIVFLGTRYIINNIIIQTIIIFFLFSVVSFFSILYLTVDFFLKKSSNKEKNTITLFNIIISFIIFVFESTGILMFTALSYDISAIIDFYGAFICLIMLFEFPFNINIFFTVPIFIVLMIAFSFAYFWEIYKVEILIMVPRIICMIAFYLMYFGVKHNLFSNFMEFFTNVKNVDYKNKIIKNRITVNENILCSIIPQHIVKNVINGSKKITNIRNESLNYVCFIKIIYKTKIDSENYKGFIQLISEVFSEFDYYVKENMCTKIKSTNLTYILCSNDIIEQKDQKLVNIINFIKKIMKYVNNNFNDKQFTNQNFKLKVGLHYGKVSGTIIGIKNFLYDIFGQTVNMAARLCNMSELNHLHCCDKSIISFISKEYSAEGFKNKSLKIKGIGCMETIFYKILEL